MLFRPESLGPPFQMHLLCGGGRGWKAGPASPSPSRQKFHGWFHTKQSSKNQPRAMGTNRRVGKRNNRHSPHNLKVEICRLLNILNQLHSQKNSISNWTSMCPMGWSLYAESALTRGHRVGIGKAWGACTPQSSPRACGSGRELRVRIWKWCFFDLQMKPRTESANLNTALANLELIIHHWIYFFEFQNYST